MNPTSQAEAARAKAELEAEANGRKEAIQEALFWREAASQMSAVSRKTGETQGAALEEENRSLRAQLDERVREVADLKAELHRAGEELTNKDAQIGLLVAQVRFSL